MNEYIPARLIFALLLATACGAHAAPTPVTHTEAATTEQIDAGPKAATTDLDALTAHPWQWVFLTHPEEELEVESPADHTVAFNSDGIVEIVADCNTAIASYGVVGFDAGSLSMTVTPRTTAACPSKSRGDQFLSLLGRAARYYFKDGQLFIDLTADKGTMVFAPAKVGSR